MITLESVLTETLSTTGMLEPQLLGKRELQPINKPATLKRLEAVSRQSKALLWILIAMHVATFLAGLGLCLHWRDSANLLVAATSGSILSVGAIIRSMRSVFRDAVEAELIRAAILELPPEDATKVIGAVLFNRKPNASLPANKSSKVIGAASGKQK